MVPSMTNRLVMFALQRVIQFKAAFKAKLVTYLAKCFHNERMVSLVSVSRSKQVTPGHRPR